jgi:hypothetical protein
VNDNQAQQPHVAGYQDFDEVVGAQNSLPRAKAASTIATISHNERGSPLIVDRRYFHSHLNT